MAGGRPTKYTPDGWCFCGTLDYSSRLPKRCVYIICDTDSNPVYVGKTKNLQKRSEKYRSKTSHNTPLNEWLRENEHILYAEPELFISNREFELIEKFKDQLFNKVHCEQDNWVSAKKPWMAKTGVKCPSTIIICKLRSNGNKKYNNLISEIKLLRKAMTDVDRCVYELKVASDIYKSRKKDVDKWLSYTEGDMTKIIEGAIDGE